MNIQGYLNIPLNETYEIKVDDTHTLYVEESGNPEGEAVVFLHGGPGGSISEKSRRFFNPKHYRIIAFDQRGTGKSTPFLSLENNTIFHSVSDMEVIREKLKIDRWYVFGGSYGTTLALVYAIAHPKRVRHLILRGIFLGRQEDMDWLYLNGPKNFYPKEYQKFIEWIDEEDRGDLIKAYYYKMTTGDEQTRKLTMKKWADWESGLVNIFPKFNQNPEIKESDLSIGLLEAYYFANHMFWPEENYILNHVDKIQSIPTDIVHGRYDVNCRVRGAYELKKALPQANLHIIEAGAHSPYEPYMMNELVTIMDQLVQ